jgi:hypothetical protein
VAKPNRTDKEQSKRFIEAARELGCDEDEDALKARMKRLAESKPTPLKSLPKRTLRKTVNTPPEVRSIPTPRTRRSGPHRGAGHAKGNLETEDT